MPRACISKKLHRKARYTSPYTLLCHSVSITATQKTAPSTSTQNGINLPIGVVDRVHAFNAAVHIWVVGDELVDVAQTTRDAVLTLWDACNPGTGDKFFRQRSKWQRFVAFVFMVLDNARNGRRLDCHVRKCSCVWEDINSLACIQTIPVRLCVKSSWYTTRQVKFMGNLDRISRENTTKLDCVHCVQERM
jgi:hypothetical protein